MITMISDTNRYKGLVLYNKQTTKHGQDTKQ